MTKTKPADKERELTDKTIATTELTEIICNAIQDEPYFTKEVLIPKIRALITGFRLNLATKNYSKNYNNIQTAKLIRENEIHNLQKIWWKQQLIDVIGKENIKPYYDKLDKKIEEWKKLT